jgi:PTH2 family peptidyl-tRNA hydrolase
MTREVKQVIIMIKDLKMRRGKEIAQGSHASLSFLTRQFQGQFNNGITRPEIKLTKAMKEWISSSFTKICLYVNSESELLEIYNKAIDANLECHLITDSGKTEFNGIPTKTCLAIGPDYADEIDEITRCLNLY